MEMGKRPANREASPIATSTVRAVAVALKWMCVSVYLHLGQLKWPLNRLTE